MTRLIFVVIGCWIRIKDLFSKLPCAVGGGLPSSPDGNQPVELKWRLVAGLVRNLFFFCICIGKSGSIITFILFQALWQDGSHWCSAIPSSALVAASLLQCRASACATPQRTPEHRRADRALVWATRLELSQQHCHTWHKWRGAGGGWGGSSTAWLWEGLSGSDLQLLFLIISTVATNSTRGPKVPVSCVCPTVPSWGTWGWKAISFFPW